MLISVTGYIGSGKTENNNKEHTDVIRNYNELKEVIK